MYGGSTAKVTRDKRLSFPGLPVQGRLSEAKNLVQLALRPFALLRVTKHALSEANG
jgi:hypothetical protein